MASPTVIQNMHLRPFDRGMTSVFLLADRMGLSLSQVFEPGRFSAKQCGLAKDDLMFIRASDGWCWALVSSLDENGRLVLEREASASASAPALPLVDETSTRSRRAAAQEHKQ